MEVFLGSKWEGLDEERTWARCTIRAIYPGQEHLVRFDGWCSRYDGRLKQEELRRITTPGCNNNSKVNANIID